MMKLRAATVFALMVLCGSMMMAGESLNQAAFVSDTTQYKFGHNSIPNIPVTRAPDDTDWSRWAMLHDGEVYRLYFFKNGSNDTLYQFGFKASASVYEWGYKSIPELKITGAPADADAGSFAMLHDGIEFRLYLRCKGNPTLLYQFAFNRRTEDYEYGYHSIPKIAVTKFPQDTDFSRWVMLHDGEDYRFYAFQSNSTTNFYQAAFNRDDSEYQWSYRSIPMLTLVGTPVNSNTSSAAMLHDGDDFRFYFQTQ